ncbi:hypothetical conserved protein [Rhizobium etli CIAT 652]|uniref:Hypothetical conserved protein n=1 Tax=Rhizobium etli (strain CIAT 652) TaxID=491916 RepID=B3PUD4_RHIE6|nr:hypothetical conserved protein [Rhizobium etli CIAT 652]
MPRGSQSPRRRLRQAVQRLENLLGGARFAGAQLHRPVAPYQDQPELARRRSLQPLSDIVGIKIPVVVEQREGAAACDDEHFDIFLNETHMGVAQPFVLDHRAIVLRIGEDDQHPLAVAKLFERLRKFRLTPRCADDFLNDGFQHGAIPRPSSCDGLCLRIPAPARKRRGERCNALND